ncbi:serine hydrolase domain-containing protein [Luteolibacter soli]|uniref:Serine hydrolase domain-containing protein n=1 Tax=Luteolibacter soli TaxID=3135280 RepID=A0ABU9AT49_9BACT
MPPIDRRNCLKRLAFTLPALAFPRAWAVPTLDPAGKEAEAIEALAQKFMKEFSVPGLSVAFAHQGKMVFRGAYGFADETSQEKLTPEHTFRIASVSKPLTSVAIYGLIEQGKLKPDAKVFVPDGLLAVDGGKKLPPKVGDVTVHHLLTHTAGGWGNDRDDPMFQHPELGHADLIARTVRDHPLQNDPGTSYAYSNFGYCVLGRIVEKLTGKPYDQHVRETVLERCDIHTMKIAGNTLAERGADEVVYYGRNGENPYNMNVRRMDSHGGWIARPEDLVKFLTHFDGLAETPDLLREATLKEMFRGTKANAGYASGWAVNAVPNHWHNGSLPGTASIAVTTASGMCWAGFTNARSGDINSALDRLMWDMTKCAPEWRA